MIAPYYEQDGIKLFLGDCRDILPQLGKVDLVLTDPPYFQPLQTSAGSRDNPYRKSLGDMSIFKTAFDVYCADLSKALKTTGSMYMFCDSQTYPFLYQCAYPLFKNVRLLIWDRIASYNGYTWRRQHELVLWSECEDAERIETGDGDVLRFASVKQEEREHPVQKPVELLAKIVAKYPVGSTILDPFCGSGTTLVAAKQLGRKAIGIEISPKYCDIAIKRLAQMQIEFK